MPDNWEDDVLDRKADSIFLEKYLISSNETKVLNINSPWGSGKTFFLERWVKDLKKNYVCIYFNAWMHDFSQEPLLSIVAHIKKEVPTSDKELSKKVIKRTAEAFRHGTPVAFKMILNKITGVALDELDEAIQGAAEVATEASEKVIEKLLEDQGELDDVVNSFKASLADLFKEYIEKNELQDQIFIIVDELDRCRPTYAIELLERIKHFFDMDNCKFVIASDTAQLEQSIKVIYGDGFDSRAYLKRFFDVEFSLESSRAIDFIDLHANPSWKIPESMEQNSQSRGAFGSVSNERLPTAESYHEYAFFDKEYRFVVLWLYALSRMFGVQLREIHSNIKKINAAWSSSGDRQGFLYLSFLVFMRDARPDLYKRAFLDLNTTLNTRFFDGINPCYVFVDDKKVSPLEVFRVYRDAIYLNEETRRFDMLTPSLSRMMRNEIYNNRVLLAGFPKLIGMAFRMS